MNIFEHILPDHAILGIGPLMLEYTTSPEENILYASRRYLFDLHLSAHTAVIKSDWFRVKDNRDEQAKMHQWRETYLSIRERVAKNMGELTDQRKLHEETVDNTYKNSIETLEDLLHLMEPTFDDATTSISLKRTRLYDNLEELKNLALK